MEPADVIKINMTVEEARKILPPGSEGLVTAKNISTKIRGREFTPAQAQAALVLAWNDLLSLARFSFRDVDYTEAPRVD